MPAFAQWSSNSNLNIAICTAVNSQYAPTIVSDGAGGAIIAWEDTRNGPPDIYAQRIDSSGVVQWTTDGIAASTAIYSQANPTIASDGAGGAIIVWGDARSGIDTDIYAQRIDADGTAQWDSNGTPISTAAYYQEAPAIVSDGAGGAIIVWQDSRGDTAYDIYAQRIGSSGVLQWTTDGVAVSAATYSQASAAIVSDRDGGAIIAWMDSRGSSRDIYAQRVDSSGILRWTSDGVPISTAAFDQSYPVMLSDGAGGAIIAWGGDNDISAQRINSLGNVLWTVNGVLINNVSIETYPAITSDGAGGAIITWGDYRFGSYPDIYAQRINSFGTVEWAGDGIPICAADSSQANPIIVSDDEGGAIIAWGDERNGPSPNIDVFAQRIDSSGVEQWSANSIPVSTAPGRQVVYDVSVRTQQIVTDGRGGAIIVWTDLRGSDGIWPDTSHIYAQQVSTSGNLGEITDVFEITPPSSGFRLHQNFPNPFNPSTRIRFTIPSTGFVSLKVYNLLGQEVTALANREMNAGTYEIIWDATGYAGGVYLCRLQTNNFIETRKLVLLR